MTRRNLVIVDGVRTPFLRLGTEFAALGADELGRLAFSALLTRTGFDPARVDEVIIGCVGQPMDAANVARVIALRAGVPPEVPAISVHRNCASGFEAITQAWEKLQAGRGEVFLVGGAESMSQYPLAFTPAAAAKFGELTKAKTLGARLRAFARFRPRDFLAPRVGLKLGLTDPVSGLNMGQTAELLAREAGLTRAELDAFAAESHRRALAARERLREEIAPAFIPPAFAQPVLDDNGPREDSTPEKLARLRPVFEPETGLVTAGNSSQVTDGAVALLVMSEEKAKNYGFTQPLGRLGPYAYAGLDPARMGLGPVHALDRLERLCGRALAEADLVEINEAFAAQVLACLAALRDPAWCREKLGREAALGEIDPARLNVNGGAIALGHPVGASGARLVLTALRELRRRDGRRALCTACVGGGQGAALWVERA
jgi:acetyl-CoA C-acetyltransferase/acetyl-CoA acyltransferase